MSGRQGLMGMMVGSEVREVGTTHLHKQNMMRYVYAALQLSREIDLSASLHLTHSPAPFWQPQPMLTWGDGTNEVCACVC